MTESERTPEADVRELMDKLQLMDRRLNAIQRWTYQTSYWTRVAAICLLVAVLFSFAGGIILAAQLS